MGPDEAYRPQDDIDAPYPEDEWRAAGFEVVAFNQDDSAMARKHAVAFGWYKKGGVERLSAAPPGAFNPAVNYYVEATIAGGSMTVDISTLDYLSNGGTPFQSLVTGAVLVGTELGDHIEIEIVDNVIGLAAVGEGFLDCPGSAQGTRHAETSD